MDFDDLLVKTMQMLRQNSTIAEFYQHHFQFILVDEYQDTNRLQSELIDLLAIRHRSVMVVGDDAQSIYSWRGANYQNILDFPRRYPDAQNLPNRNELPERSGNIGIGECRNPGKHKAVFQNVACSPRRVRGQTGPCLAFRHQSTGGIRCAAHPGVERGRGRV